MIPPDAFPELPPRPRVCSDCGEPLESGQKWRCIACCEAAYRAVEQAGPGVVVLPSDIRRERDAPPS